jgi:hypothetical protein
LKEEEVEARARRNQERSVAGSARMQQLGPTRAPARETAPAGPARGASRCAPSPSTAPSLSRLLLGDAPVCCSAFPALFGAADRCEVHHPAEADVGWGLGVGGRGDRLARDPLQKAPRPLVAKVGSPPPR